MLNIFKNISEIIYPSDDENKRARYLGYLKNGVPSGHGTMTWKDGQIYKGTKNRSITIILNNNDAVGMWR